MHEKRNGVGADKHFGKQDVDFDDSITVTFSLLEKALLFIMTILLHFISSLMLRAGFWSHFTTLNVLPHEKHLSEQLRFFGQWRRKKVKATNFKIIFMNLKKPNSFSVKQLKS